jgi:hypothetical protein
MFEKLTLFCHSDDICETLGFHGDEDSCHSLLGCNAI